MGSQRRTGSFSFPGTALGPIKGYAASNLACPQAVSGERNFSFTASIPRAPGTLSRGYCIQIPDRSCERAGDALDGVSAALAVPDLSAVWANAIEEKARNSARKVNEQPVATDNMARALQREWVRLTHR